MTAVRVARYIALFSPISKFLEPKLSDILKEKLIAAPSIGYWPCVKEPRSFNEKVLHRKLCTDDPRFSTIADKWAVRSFVSERLGDKILNEVYHLTDDPSSIPFDTLPEQFVIKSTHGWNQILLVEDKSTMDVEDIRATCRDFLDQRHGLSTNEYWYSEIEPRLLVERYLTDEEHNVPPDFKFFVFHGTVKLIQVNLDRFNDHRMRYYEPDWTPIDLRKAGVPLGPVMDEPTRLEKMIEVSETLGEEFDFVRVDLYQPDGNSVIFGEMTLSPAAGRNRFNPISYDFELGSHW